MVGEPWRGLLGWRALAFVTELFAQSASAIHLREQEGAYQHDGGDAKEGKVVVAGGAYYIAEDHGTKQPAEIAGGVHHSGRCATVVATQVQAHGPRSRQHQVHHSEAQGEYSH